MAMNDAETAALIAGGHTFNVIPESVLLRGTARWFLPEVGDLLERRFQEIVTGIATAMGCTATASFTRSYPATVNEAESTELAARAARAVAGEARTRTLPQPTMGGEDFAFMLNEKPGAYLFLGGGTGQGDAMVHHPKYDFNDEILPIGASWLATLAEQLMELRGLRGKSGAKTRLMLERVEAEAADFERCTAKLSALRSVQARILKSLLAQLSADSLRREVGAMHAAMTASLFNLGGKAAFETLMSRVLGNLAKARQQVDEMRETLTTGAAMAEEDRARREVQPKKDAADL
jgi:hypothetical protein